MTEPLLGDVRQFLRALEATQDELAALFERKRETLTTASPAAIERLAQTETELNARLQKLLGTRGRLLQRAGQAGFPSDSIRHLVARIGGAETDELVAQMDRAARIAAKLRTESWAHWILAQRASQHYGHMLDLIAHAGQKSPTYSRGLDRSATGGGILDATA